MMAVYARNDCIVITASAVTSIGLWLESAPCIRLAPTASDHDLGAAARSILARSGQEIPQPDWKVTPPPGERTAERAGFRSWESLVRGALLVEVERNAEGVVLQPMRNRGPKSGFEALGPPIALSGDIPEAREFGARLREALKRSAT
ncbi:hypothetical protein ACH34R_14420 [Spongiactinospora sp. 9N601]